MRFSEARPTAVGKARAGSGRCVKTEGKAIIGGLDP